MQITPPVYQLLSLVLAEKHAQTLQHNYFRINVAIKRVLLSNLKLNNYNQVRKDNKKCGRKLRHK